MTTLTRETIQIQPGERAIVYLPVPIGVAVLKVDRDPQTAAAFTLISSNFIGASRMLAETGLRCPAVRIELENRTADAKRARFFVDVDRDPSAVSREIGTVADRHNRYVHELRRRRGMN